MDRQGDCNIASSLSGGIIKSWLRFCDQYFWKFPIWNSRADEKRREIRMVKVNVIFNDIRLLICLTLLCKCVYTIGIPFRPGLTVIPQIPGSYVNSSVTMVDQLQREHHGYFRWRVPNGEFPEILIAKSKSRFYYTPTQRGGYIAIPLSVHPL
jgi:hypothetical protein